MRTSNRNFGSCGAAALRGGLTGLFHRAGPPPRTGRNSGCWYSTRMVMRAIHKVSPAPRNKSKRTPRNLDARSAGPPSFSFALQSPRNCSSCVHYQLRSATGIAASARWHFRIARDGLDLGFETEGCAAGRARAFSVCVPCYLNLCFVKNDEEGVSKASPRRGTRRS